MTQVPLKILITDSKLLDNLEVKEQINKLTKAGHEVLVDDSFSAYDFITGPNCWLLRPEVSGLFTLAITNARKIANADQERVNQVTAAKARKKATGASRKRTPRNTKATSAIGVEGPSTVDPSTLFDTDQTGQLNGAESTT